MVNNNAASAETSGEISKDQLHKSEWQIMESKLEPKVAPTLEAIYTLANGFRSLRGSSPFLKTVIGINQRFFLRFLSIKI